jgi:hypothetical protein
MLSPQAEHPCPPPRRSWITVMPTTQSVRALFPRHPNCVWHGSNVPPPPPPPGSRCPCVTLPQTPPSSATCLRMSTASSSLTTPTPCWVLKSRRWRASRGSTASLAQAAPAPRGSATVRCCPRFGLDMALLNWVLWGDSLLGLRWSWVALGLVAGPTPPPTPSPYPPQS